MTEIGFYHLTRTTVEAALPPLLDRTLKTGQRALVLCANPERAAALDIALWRAPAPDWLPHGTAATPHPEWQPIYITDTETNPAAANFLFLIDSTTTANAATYTRIFDLFDGNNETALNAARSRYREAKAGGHSITYWKQGELGWEKAG